MTVWTLFIEHRHGFNLSVHDSEESADKAAISYCRAEWDDRCQRRWAREHGDQPVPDDQIVAFYFDVNEEEAHEIEKQDVLGAEASAKLYEFGG